MAFPIIFYQANNCMAEYHALEADVMNLQPYNNFVNCARKVLGMGEWEGAYQDADDEMLREFRLNGKKLHKNGISLKIYPRLNSFMVDYMVGGRSPSAAFWHGVKDPKVLQKHWKVQEDNTIFPKVLYSGLAEGLKYWYGRP